MLNTWKLAKYQFDQKQVKDGDLSGEEAFFWELFTIGFGQSEVGKGQFNALSWLNGLKRQFQLILKPTIWVVAPHIKIQRKWTYAHAT